MVGVCAHHEITQYRQDRLEWRMDRMEKFILGTMIIMITTSFSMLWVLVGLPDRMADARIASAHIEQVK